MNRKLLLPRRSLNKSRISHLFKFIRDMKFYIECGYGLRRSFALARNTL